MCLSQSNVLKGEILYLIDTDERLSKFLTIDKRARWPRQENGHGFKRRKYRRLGSNQQLKLELS